MVRLFKSFLAVIAIGIATLVVATPASADSNFGCFTDGGIRVQVCIYQDTGTNYVRGAANYLQVTGYRFKVTNVGGSQVSLSGSLTMRAAAFGSCSASCSGYSSGASKSQTVAISGNHTFSFSVPWHAATVKVGDGIGTQSANAQLTYTFRGKKQTFQTPSLCVGDIPSIPCINV